MEDINLKSETIDKAIDVIADSTKDTRNALDTNTSKGINKFFDFLKATPMGIKIDTYIAERPYKLEQALEQMKLKYDKIPDENKKEPNSYIALKVANNLNYCLDEQHLKDMFINILISDMDNRKNNNVKPAFIEMVTQLSKEDAETLKFFSENKLSNEPIMKLKMKYKSGGFDYCSNDIFLILEDSYTVLNPITIDNLLRLKIIEITFMEYRNNDSIYEKAFKDVSSNISMNQPPPPYIEKLDYAKGVLRITNLGKNFIDICLS